MVYYIIDVRFPKAFKRSDEFHNRIVIDESKPSMEDFEFDYLYHFVYPNQSINKIVRDTKGFILNAKLGYQSVDMIRLCGHGDSGKLQFGMGLNESNAGEFSELAPFMKRDLYRVGVEIHGCGVGSDTSIIGRNATINNPACVPGSTQNGDRGLNFLKKLAKAVNRNVVAGINCQTVYLQDENWKFEGPTLTVKPDGNSWLK